MITYIKLNDIIADIYFNDEKVGHIEKHYGFYRIEVNYTRCDFPNAKKKMIPNYIKKLLVRLEARKRRSMEKIDKLKNRKEFKILY